MEKLTAHTFLQKASRNILLDVRSPGEYLHAHIPGAVNLPLFSDEERKVVGTAYKQESREKAIKLGLDFFGVKMRKMLEEVEEIIANRQSTICNNDNCLFLYCWRGGMRSSAVAWLLNLYGYKVYLLAGGYKAYRNYVLQSFEQSYSLKILGGFTGSGKTEVLKELEKSGENIIDLEGIANHKGSAFGNIGLHPQPSQEMFENLLARKLKSYTEPLEKNDSVEQINTSPGTTDGIWVEDESQRIGNINLPNSFWETMRKSPIYFLDISFEERLKHIIEEYGSLDRERLQNAIERISKRLGGLETKNAIAALQAGDIEGCFRILLQYYDKLYLKGLHNRENLTSRLNKFECATVTPENAALLQKHQAVI